MMELLLVIIGVLIGGWAWKASTLTQNQRPVILQGTLGGLIQFSCMFGGLWLIVYGVAHFFSVPIFKIIIGFILFAVVLMLMGKKLGARNVSKMTTPRLLSELKHTEATIINFFDMPLKNQEKKMFKKKHEDLESYLQNLEKEIIKRDASECATESEKVIFRTRVKILINRLLTIAEQGNMEAQYQVGLFFLKSKNHKDAVKWFYEAAKQGDAGAQGIVGTYRYKGTDGVIEKDLVQSYVWLTLGDSPDLYEAKEILAQCKREMTKEQIAKADRMVVKYKAIYKK